MTKSRIGRRVKLSIKAQEALTQTTLYQTTLPVAKQNSEVENLVFHLIKLLKIWDTNEKRDV